MYFSMYQFLIPATAAVRAMKRPAAQPSWVLPPPSACCRARTDFPHAVPRHQSRFPDRLCTGGGSKPSSSIPRIRFLADPAVMSGEIFSDNSGMSMRQDRIPEKKSNRTCDDFTGTLLRSSVIGGCNINIRISIRSSLRSHQQCIRATLI